MRLYTPTSEVAAIRSSDAIARHYVLNGYAKVARFDRCDDTGALLVDFTNGHTVEIYNGERESHTGVALDRPSNFTAWLASIRRNRANEIRDELTKAADAIAEESGKARDNLSAIVEELQAELASLAV